MIQGKTKNVECRMCKRGCIYWQPLHSRNGYNVCHYLLETGEPRNSPPGRCDKFTMDTSQLKVKNRKELILGNWKSQLERKNQEVVADDQSREEKVSGAV